jgi:Co/Zn/Cd efflux system component
MTAHVIIHPESGMEQLNILKLKIKHELEHANIHHVTIEFETEDEDCKDMHSI